VAAWSLSPLGAARLFVGSRFQARFIDAVRWILAYEPCALLAGGIGGLTGTDAIGGRVDALLT
jgi:hypothetical protein